MEQFNLFRLIVRHWLMVLLVTLLVGGLSLAFYHSKPSSVFGTLTATVQAEPRPAASGQAILQPAPVGDAQLVVSTVQSWAGDPVYAAAALKQAGVSASDSSLKGLSQAYKVVAPVAGSGSFQIQFTGDSQDEVNHAFEGLKTVLNENVASYNQQAGSDLLMHVSYAGPLLTDVSGSLPLVPFAGLAAGLILSLVLAAFVEQKRA